MDWSLGIEQRDRESDSRVLKSKERGGRGRRKKTRDECAKNDTREWGLIRGMTKNRANWRSVIHGNHQTRVMAYNDLFCVDAPLNNH